MATIPAAFLTLLLAQAAGQVPGTAALTAVYLGGFGLSHPLAKRIGAWPAVLSAAGVSAASAHVAADRR